MGQIEDIEKLRKRRSRRQSLKRLGSFLLILLVIGGIWLLWEQAKKANLAEQILGGFAEMGSGDGFPMEFSGVTIHEIDTMGKLLLVLTDTHLHIYNQNGKEVRQVAHGFKNPIMKHSGGRILLYDTVSKTLRVESKTDTVKEMEFEYPVLFAEISRKNDLVVITNAKRYLGQIMVFDHNMNEPVFHWLSAENYLYGAALSDDGSVVAVSSVAVDQGDLVSTLHIYQTGKEEAILTERFADETIHHLGFRGGEWEVLTNKGAYYYSAQGKNKAEYSYASENLQAYCAGDGFTALLTGDFREFKSLSVKMLGESGGQSGAVTMKSQVAQIDARGNFLALLSDNRLEIYNALGELSEMIQPETEVLHLALGEKVLYYVVPTGIFAKEIGS